MVILEKRKKEASVSHVERGTDSTYRRNPRRRKRTSREKDCFRSTAAACNASIHNAPYYYTDTVTEH